MSLRKNNAAIEKSLTVKRQQLWKQTPILDCQSV